MKKIGVLTSGGDAPGMNAAIRAVVRAAIRKDLEVVGIYRGYSGLIDGEIKPLGATDVSNIIQRGGTVLLTARCPEFKTKEGILKAKSVCEEQGIDGIVVIGGDGSFRGAADLSAAGIPCIGLPGTIDNDIAMTEYTIGYDTAMNTATELIDKLIDTTCSHERCSVVEVMGRHAGYIALNTGIACGASAIITEEMPYDLEEVIRRISISRAGGKNHFVVVVSEGVGSVQEIAQQIQDKTGIVCRATILGHVQRGGSPSVRDRVEASRMGYHAVHLLAKGVGNRVVGVKKGDIIDVDIQEALSMSKEFPKELYHIANTIAL